MPRSTRTVRALVRGRVQGLGFRPFVYRLAVSFGVTGTVANSTEGVEILVQGRRADSFVASLRTTPPPLARVSSFTVQTCIKQPFDSFRIINSRHHSGTGVEVLPDIATCAECRSEISNRQDRRYRYSFTNCTQCGPRYTIIRSLPYDRPRTTMAQFKMCTTCSYEYSEPADRRFHAQPNACPQCGPALRLTKPDGTALAGDPLVIAARAITRGKIVAVLSLGGYQLACDATSARAVRLLRRRKSRPTKPLAMMVESVADAGKLCRLTRTGRDLLKSPAAPIVLLRKRPDPQLPVSDLIAPNNRRFGVMLAYTPLHLLLFQALRAAGVNDPVLVMTSANRSEDPIIASEAELRSDLAGVVDFVLSHDRAVENRCDDSVVLDGEPPVFVRRARGYSPQSVQLGRTFHVKHPTLALGGEIRNCFALAAGNRTFLSPHIGSLASPRAESFFLATLAKYIAWTGIKPTQLACDLHPDYLSTRVAERLSRKWRIPLFRIQHHHAHVVSVMAEQNIGGPVLGLAFDGAGYGSDGKIWGCEFLLVSRDLDWTRVGHLGELLLPESGGAIADPGRIASGYMLQVTGSLPRYLGLLKKEREAKARLVSGNATPTSSLGRLFDAVAALTGICRTATFEGEAPIALEAAASDSTQPFYRRAVSITRGDPNSSGPAVIDPASILTAVVDDLVAGANPASVAASFQNTIVRAAAEVAVNLTKRYHITTVVLSGGSFQNDRLRHGIVAALTSARLQVVTNQLVPVNDGGVSLGQAVVAGRR